MTQITSASDFIATQTIEEIYEQCLTEILIEIDKLLSRMDSVEKDITELKNKVNSNIVFNNITEVQ